MEDKLIKIIADIIKVEVSVNDQNIDNYALGKVSGWDSLAHLAIMAEIESMLEVELSIEEMEDLDSIKKIIEYVKNNN